MMAAGRRALHSQRGRAAVQGDPFRGP